MAPPARTTTRLGIWNVGITDTEAESALPPNRHLQLTAFGARDRAFLEPSCVAHLGNAEAQPSDACGGATGTPRVSENLAPFFDVALDATLVIVDQHAIYAYDAPN